VNSATMSSTMRMERAHDVYNSFCPASGSSVSAH
jgi:hypothetical protein